MKESVRVSERERERTKRGARSRRLVNRSINATVLLLFSFRGAEGRASEWFVGRKSMNVKRSKASSLVYPYQLVQA